MKDFFRKRIFLMMILCICLIFLELLTDWHFLGLFGIGFFLICLSLYIERYWLNRLFLGLGLVLVIVTIVLTRSFWLFLLTVFFALIIFNKGHINEMGNLSESMLHPGPKESENYYGIKLIQPQDQQRTILQYQSLFDMREDAKKVSYEWDDINLVYFGGNSIIDLGNTLIPAGEHTVLIRKMFGRVRLIIPRDIGLNMNISLISGRVMFESQDYELTLENFKWRSPDYQQANRKLSFIVSSVIGDVEVIIL
ncbi:cell wall-active antibiotics response protein LiaF [Facklamia miroungae]|uniref:Predicted membrane protein n=1 Tax=Facklamia miroungae TaxID=120956 RepID=A0A1G7V6R7_9LACT|nr:cell wall-active antibiotics response protein LiaF [Facklamia miroungae]NKZ30261.1 cell wall-active antibiotics response protein [Facklamia miroungae]SDG55502.1 Predicted membrane protein [Facklamia miroungae]